MEKILLFISIIFSSLMKEVKYIILNMMGLNSGDGEEAVKSLEY